MTKEEKELLLKDLCARLPYGVIVDVSRVEEWKELTLTPFILSNYYDDIEKIKPYLRPMSSMTEKEKKVYDKLRMNYYKLFSTESSSNLIDWLNEHHFDYRVDPETGKSMIDMELAIEAPGDMYKTE